MASAVGLIVLSPLFLVVSIFIVLDDPKGSPIFVQTGVGKDGKEFRFYKFRSIANMDSLEYSYCLAKRFADEHGVKIYNATRGGKLETFERIDFDAVVK